MNTTPPVTPTDKPPAPVYSQDWFSRNIPAWTFLLKRLAKENNPLRILEVGVFEGRSTCWLLENFCKTPASLLVAVDTFQGGIEHKGMELASLRSRFESNIRTVASPARVDIREGFSLPELARLVVEKPQPFDFISIDASHQAPDVLGDAVLAFQLLRVGGVMAFDDYLWSPTPQGTENPILLPKMAIDAFTTAYSRRLRILSGLPLYQLYIQRTA